MINTGMLTRGLAWLAAVALGGAIACSSGECRDPIYDPLAVARSTPASPEHLEAAIPPQCYTVTEGRSNPCYVCHGVAVRPHTLDDFELQREYAFSDRARTSPYSGLFVDREAEARAISEAEVLRWIRTDVVAPLRAALEAHDDYAGYVPDLDFARGFDALGFANDGSHWRAIRYVPFPGAFFPTNGSADDVFLRLPLALRTRADGTPDREVERINFAILEAAMGGDPDIATANLVRTIEPLDEAPGGLDLDGDGQLASARVLRGLPAFYVGAGASVPVRRYVHPRGTEYLHTVRYLDPEAPDLRAARTKEVRYMRREEEPDDWAMNAAVEEENEEAEEGRPPRYPGSPETGFLDPFGWRLQAFIEDRNGSLRLQTADEHRFCMGCHGGIGGTIDSVFSLPRKVPGLEGWRVQDLHGLVDLPETGHAEPELLEYFRRVGAADELRANDEMLARFWPNGVLDDAEVRRASRGGDRDLAWLLSPSRERALDLNRAYMLIVRAQSYLAGRDATLRPAAHVHRVIDDESTGLGEADRVYTDAHLTLAW